MNGDITQECTINLYSNMSLKDLLIDSMEQFNIATSTRCKLYESTGYEINDDDVDFLDDNAPLFLS